VVFANTYALTSAPDGWPSLLKNLCYTCVTYGADMRHTWKLSVILLAALIGCKKEVCDNNIDDNGDGATDCDDETCSQDPSCGARCGDAEINAGEQCDGANLNGQSCESFGFDGGTLSCNTACQFVEDQCTAGACGDGTIDNGEECDGNNLGGASCISVGLEDGALGCSNICTFDTSGCGNGGSVCGNNIVEGNEECDDGNTTAGDGCSSTCTNENVGNGALVINEVDYDQFNSDTASFVEIFNGGNGAANLVGFSLVFVNGADTTEYGRVDLSSAGTLNAGQFLVVGNDSVLVSLPGAVKVISQGTDDFLQNGGPDGILLLDANNQVVDSFSYEGSVATATIDPGGSVNFLDTGFDGSDTNDDLNSIARNADGVDTNNGNADWSITSTITPGASNP
jgi:cysteine-rich repeat protein